jgi:outer membrane protein
MSRERLVRAALAVLVVPFVAPAGALGAQTAADSAPARPAMPRMPTMPMAVVDTTARPITLDDAIALAQRNAPTAVQARGQARTSAAAVRSSYAAFLPSISLSAGGSRTFTAEGDRTYVDPNGQIITAAEDWSYSSGLSFGMTLFEGGRRLYDVRSARANLDAASANEVSQRYDVALQVSQQYFAVLAAREAEAAAQSQLEQAEQQLAAAAARTRAGAATRSDSLRSVVQVGNAQLALLTARNQLASANAALTRLVAAPDLVTATTDPALDAIVALPDSATLDRMLAQSPAVLEADAARVAARAAGRAARSPYLPTVSLNYSRRGSGEDSRLGLGDADYGYRGSLSLNVTYPLFNQLTREENVVRASVAEDVAEAQLRDAQLRAREDLTSALGTLETAEQRIRIGAVSVTAAEEDLRVVQQRYNLGASTLLDVLTSQTQLNQARSDLIQARFDYRVARAQLEALLGRDLP